jgi:hypothetical protein
MKLLHVALVRSSETRATAGIEVRRAVRGSSSVVFIADEDGNLFEIKERA